MIPFDIFLPDSMISCIIECDNCIYYIFLSRFMCQEQMPFFGEGQKMALKRLRVAPSRHGAGQMKKIRSHQSMLSSAKPEMINYFSREVHSLRALNKRKFKVSVDDSTRGEGRKRGIQPRFYSSRYMEGDIFIRHVHDYSF